MQLYYFPSLNIKSLFTLPQRFLNCIPLKLKKRFFCGYYEGICKSKGKVHPCTGTEARDIALFFLDRGTSWGVRGQRHAWTALYPPGKDPVPIVQEAGRATGPFWTGAENLAPHRDSIPVPSSP